MNTYINNFCEFGLSPRQSEVLLMISNGYTNVEIAAALGISPETVKTHLKIVFKRTKIHKRTQAIEVVGRTLGLN